MATANQISLARLDEDIRSHQVQEHETARSNRAREAETTRSNMARESENYRHNVALERETSFHNRTMESQGWFHEHEINRHNVATERESQRSDVAKERETERSNRAGERIRSRDVSISASRAATERQKVNANVDLIGQQIKESQARSDYLHQQAVNQRLQNENFGAEETRKWIRTGSEAIKDLAVGWNQTFGGKKK